MFCSQSLETCHQDPTNTISEVVASASSNPTSIYRNGLDTHSDKTPHSFMLPSGFSNDNLQTMYSIRSGLGKFLKNISILEGTAGQLVLL